MWIKIKKIAYLFLNATPPVCETKEYTHGKKKDKLK